MTQKYVNLRIFANLHQSPMWRVWFCWKGGWSWAHKGKEGEEESKECLPLPPLSTHKRLWPRPNLYCVAGEIRGDFYCLFRSVAALGMQTAMNILVEQEIFFWLCVGSKHSWFFTPCMFYARWEKSPWRCHIANKRFSSSFPPFLALVCAKKEGCEIQQCLSYLVEYRDIYAAKINNFKESIQMYILTFICLLCWIPHLCITAAVDASKVIFVPLFLSSSSPWHIGTHAFP